MANMFRGTTPTLKVKLTTTLDVSNIANVWLTLKPKADNEITFDIDRITIDATAKTLSVTLTQEETLSLTEGSCYVQIRLVLENGMAYASKKKEVNIEGILKEGVIE